MYKNRLKKIICAVMAFVFSASAMPAAVYADKLSDAEETKQAAKQELADAEEKIEKLKNRQKKLLQKIDSKNKQLLKILADIEILEEEVEEKENEIKKTQKEYEAAEKEKQQQTERMKLRIQYLYENGNTDVVAFLVSGKDISNALNHATLTKDIYSYDRMLLDEYEAAIKKVESILETLKEEDEDLREKQDSLSEKKKELQKAIKALRKKSDSAKWDMAEMKALAKQYKETVKEQNKIIRQQIQEQIEREEAERRTAMEAAAAAVPATHAVSSYDRSYQAAGDGLGTDIANYALQFIGNPYVYGGNSLTNGIDCSGFVQQVYAHFGYSLPRTSDSQAGCGMAVSASELQPGDLVCYSGHIAIYIGGGKIVHASSQKTGIKISNNIFYRTIIGFRRII